MAKTATASLADLLLDRHIAAGNGHRDALRYGDKRYAVNDLAALANRTANMLARAGVGRGATVLAAVPPSPAFAALVVGAIKIGAAAVTFTGRIDAAAVKAALAKAKPALVVAHLDHLAAVDAAVADKNPVILVGQDTGARRSFVDLIREEPSLLAVPGDDAAAGLGLFDGAALRRLGAADLTALAAGKGDAVLAGVKAAAMLRALAKGECFTLA